MRTTSQTQMLLYQDDGTCMLFQPSQLGIVIILQTRGHQTPFPLPVHAVLQSAFRLLKSSLWGLEAPATITSTNYASAADYMPKGVTVPSYGTR